MIEGNIRLNITCVDSARLLNALNSAEVSVHNVCSKDDLVIELVIYGSDYLTVRNICNKQGAFVKVVDRFGLNNTLKLVINRPVILIFCLLVILISFYVPSRIFFISVEGNTEISTNEIIEAAESCGIVFGASRREVRSEKMKNALLKAIPDLQWAGINTTGCTAIISVREKTIQSILDSNGEIASGIVASRDGIVRSYTVYQGNLLCSEGQAVKEGQLLISGYTDCGIATKISQAKAEINALTFRKIHAISPYPVVHRTNMKDKTTRFSLRIGKKLIKLYKDSGNYDTTCAKIYLERYVRLPGGFLLPIAVIEETSSVVSALVRTAAS